VYDKQVRRRRAVLALLVAVSLILLTAYFGESPDSPLHTVQRDIASVLAPVQQGASRVLSPVRNVSHWFSDTFSAKSERDRLKKQNAQLLAQNAKLQSELIQYPQLVKQVGLDNSLGIDSYKPVTAQVIWRDPSLWYQTIQVDKGSSDGVSNNDPVTGDGGLIGLVTTVGPNFSIVTELTDHTYAVTARVLNNYGDTGVLKPDTGNPNQMLLTDLPIHATITTGQLVVTAGFKSGPLDSLYPAGIPIGTVSDPNPQDDLLNNQQVTVTPTADLRHTDVVQILTNPYAGTQRAQAPAGAG
jgi:rod shape-determining protein MreC